MISPKKRRLIFEIAGSQESLIELYAIDKTSKNSEEIFSWLVKNNFKGQRFTELFKECGSAHRVILFAIKGIEKDRTRGLLVTDLSWGKK